MCVFTVIDPVVNILWYHPFQSSFFNAYNLSLYKLFQVSDIDYSPSILCRNFVFYSVTSASFHLVPLIHLPILNWIMWFLWTPYFRLWHSYTFTKYNLYACWFQIFKAFLKHMRFFICLQNYCGSLLPLASSEHQITLLQ